MEKTTHTAISTLDTFKERFGVIKNFVTKLYAKFTKSERIVLAVLAVAIVVSSGQLVLGEGRDSQVAAASGGVHVEGVLGALNYPNPLFAGTNPADRDIVRLVYSGLTRIGAGREIIPDLAERWEVFEQGRVYVFHLRQGVKWHDGDSFTSDDVLYTMNTIQGDGYTGILKADFLGIAVEPLDEYTVRFTLPTPNSSFLFDMSLGIIPQHVFGETDVASIAASYDPLETIGTGPFRYDRSSSEAAVTLRRFKDYYGQKPYLDTVVIHFFDNERALLTAFKSRTVSAIGSTDPNSNNTPLSANDAKHSYNLPEYKAIFFNQLSDNGAIKDLAVRRALALAVNKQNIVDQVEGGLATIADSPILPGFWGHNPDMKKYNFDIGQAAQTLKNGGWADVDGDGFLEKDNVRLGFTLSIRDEAKSLKTAELLQANWKTIGADVQIQATEVSSLIKDVIRPRNYQVLLFGQDLGGNSDPYVYWHSSQIKDPGLALAVQVDKDIDNNLESARIAPDLNRAIEYYLNFQNAFANLTPAILLYQPKYIYLVDTKVKGIDENINLSYFSDRFANIDKWYVRTKRQ